MSKSTEEAKQRLIKRYGRRCMKCGYYGGYIAIHHIVSLKNGGHSNKDNVVLLCEKCHAEIHGKQKRNYIDKECEAWHARV